MRSYLLTGGKLKQTSAVVLTLCRILPYFIGVQVPHECDRWTNFLRLLQITLLATSFVTADTAGQLSQLVATHHMLFCEHYLTASVTPKMRYLIHLPKQLLRFGLLRHHCCLRFETKHAFFKSLSPKNVPKTLAKKYQLYMCHKQAGETGLPSRGFLYEHVYSPTRQRYRQRIQTETDNTSYEQSCT